jgi:outer membrane protein OmpA-like peptidoglycan-associated protein
MHQTLASACLIACVASSSVSLAQSSDRRLAVQNGLDGTTGLLRVAAADSGAAGTFRVSFGASFYRGTGTLCPPCGSSTTAQDQATLWTTRAQLSVTPLEFLEAHGSIRYQTTEDDLGRPHVIDTVGDSTLGLKLFQPARRDRVLSLGGGAKLDLRTGPGEVGIAAASVGLYGASTLDLHRIPLRAHLNLGYWLDGSGKIADRLERDRGSDQRISRIERLSYGINRVDSVRIGIGAEGAFAILRPFVEWTLEVPANSWDYYCGHVRRAAGDACLFEVQGFAATPSRVTLGVRAAPWRSGWAEGLAALGAVDIGTGATSKFVEEVVPELPWSVHLGVGYAFDTLPRTVTRTRTVEKRVEVKVAPPTRPETSVAGAVVDAATGDPVPGARVESLDSASNPILTDASGRFRTVPLEPGPHRFRISMDGYQEGECAATESAAQPLRCELRALPSAATVTGTIRDAETTVFVAAATVAVVDPRGRRLELRTDERGGFRFENVPAGTVRLQVEAPGYLPSGTVLELVARRDASVVITVNARPKAPNVVLTPQEIKLKKQVHFVHDSAEVLPDSQAILEEVAATLQSHPELARIEVQGHTDDSGTPAHNQQLSEQRAQAVREALIRIGVEPGRLVARGYGDERPLVPNSSAQNRARNRRVQLMVLSP